MAEVHPADAGVAPFDSETPAQAPLLRRLAAEFMGTALLVAIGAGAVTAATLGPLRALGSLGPELSQPPNDKLFGTLLGNSTGDLLGVALTFAIALAVLVYALGGVSGAHFNPAVTFALALARRFRWVEVPAYWVAQVLGGILGGFLIFGVFREEGIVSGTTDILLGATTLADKVGVFQALTAEALITFILVTAIMAVAVDPRAPKGWSGLIIGLSLAGGIMVTAGITGGSANFARSLGPLVASMFAGDPGNIPWKDLAYYAGGPLIGASAAALLYESITGLEQASPAPHPGAATGTGEALEVDPDADVSPVTLAGEEPDRFGTPPRGDGPPSAPPRI